MVLRLGRAPRVGWNMYLWKTRQVDRAEGWDVTVMTSGSCLDSSLGAGRGMESSGGGRAVSPGACVCWEGGVGQRLSLSNLLPLLSLQLSAWRAGAGPVPGTSVFLGEDTEMFAKEL